MCLQIILIYLALNNLQGLVLNKTQQKQKSTLKLHKINYERDSLTSRHEIALDEFTSL